MPKQTTRREVLRGGVALAGIGAFGVPAWAFPALAQGEELVEFTDLPETIVLERPPDRRFIDVRNIDGPITPADQWFTTQHHGHPEIDPDTYQLKVSGMVNDTLSLSLADLRAMPSRELVFGFECSGNRGPLNGLSSNGRWTGVPLRTVLERAGLQDRAREIVFFGADHGEEEVLFRGQTFNVDQQYGRSLPRDKALSDEPLLAYALNGEPLTTHQGRPLRLLVPGWYGAPNVKFLSGIHVQEDPYLGKYQGAPLPHPEGGDDQRRDEVGRDRDHEDAAEVVHRPGDEGGRPPPRLRGDHARRHSHRVGRGAGDDGPWQAATLDPTMTEKYSWKFFTYDWRGATPGEHTVTSRATDVSGYRQPTAEELEVKRTRLEQHNQHPRR